MRSFSRKVTLFERKRAWSRCSCEACMTERTAPSRLFSTIAPWSTHRFLSNGEAGSSRPSQRRPQDEQDPKTNNRPFLSKQSRNVRLGSSSWALSLGQRFAAEGVSIVVRLPPRFLLRLESLEERAHFAEAIGHG